MYSSGATAYPDFAAFLQHRDSEIFGTAAAPGGGNIAPLLTDMTHLRQTSQGNAQSSAHFAFNHIRSSPTGANQSAHWNTQGANGNARVTTGTVGIAVDLLEGAPENTPWPMIDTVVIYASYANLLPFSSPTGTVRGIGEIAVKSGSHTAFGAQPTANSHQTWNWGTITGNADGLATLETNPANAWRTVGGIAQIQEGNQDRVFVFTLAEPAPVRYLKALIEVVVPAGTPANLPGQVSISSFEVYNSQAVPPQNAYPNFAAFLANRDAAIFGTVNAPGAGNIAPHMPIMAHLRQSSRGNAQSYAYFAFNHVRSTPTGANNSNHWNTSIADGRDRANTGTVGIAIDLLEGAPEHTPWPMVDTVVLHTSLANNAPFFPPTDATRGIGEIAVKSGSHEAFRLQPSGTGVPHWGGIVHDSDSLATLETNPANVWRTFGNVIEIQEDNPYRVFVFTLNEPAPVRYLKALIEIIVPPGVAGTTGNLPTQIAISSFEAYNAQGTLRDVVLPPEASPAPGHFRTAQDVILTAALGASIHFTTDGTDPIETSAQFTTAINIAEDTTIRAIAIYNGIESAIATFVYIISEFAQSPFAEHYLTQRGSGFAVIDARYDGMSNVIGRPALIDATRENDRFPVFRAIDGVPGTVIVGTLHGANDEILYTTQPVTVDASGHAFITIPDTIPLTAMTTYRMAFTLTHNGRTLRDARFFTAITNFEHYRATPNEINSNNANVTNIPVDSAVNTFPALQLDSDNRLVYFPDYRGNRIMDYSAVGFRGGAEIPNVPIVREIGPFADPYRDAFRMIQEAIDYVSARPIDPETGFRGALYLREGVYRISQPLLINTSGVVIRGAGEGVPAQTSVPRYPASPTLVPGSPQNPMVSRRACQEFEPGVTKLISTWQIDPDYVQTASSVDGSTGVWRTGSAGVNRNSSNNWDTLIHVIGPAILNTPANFQSNIVDQYVGIGRYTVHLESVEGLHIGDLLFIYRAIDTNWARATYMNAIGGPNGGWVVGDNLAPGFAPNPRSPLYHERFIVAIDAATNAVTFDVAMPDSIDMRWGTSYVIRHVADNRLRNIGIENLQGISHFQNDQMMHSERFGIHMVAYVCENHPMQFISMRNVVDGWARNWVAYHFDRGFVAGSLSRNITVQDAFVLETAGLPQAGMRRYSFYISNASHVLMQRAYAHYSRHAFTWSSQVSGPNVFAFSESPFVLAATEPHFRWSSGGLFDNVAAKIYVNNRWDFGTSHGWPGVNYVLYNTTGTFIASQPQIVPNFVIGHSWDNTPENRRMFGEATAPDGPQTGRVNFQRTTQATDRLIALGLNGGIVPNFPAYEFSVGRPVNPAQDNMPESLLMQQVMDARGSAGAAIVAGNTTPPRNQWTWADDATIDPDVPTQQPLLTSLRLDGVEIAGFNPMVFSYTYSLPFGFATFPVVTAYTNQENVDITISLPTAANMRVTILLTDRDNPHNTEIYTIIFDSPSRTPIITASDRQYPNFEHNLLLGNTAHPGPIPRWASDANPAWLRLYLGYTPKTLGGVNIGFVPAGAPREYLVRFEYSMDGIAWTEIAAGTTFSAETPTPAPWAFISRPAEDQYFIRSLEVEGTSAFPANGLQHFVFDTPVEARFIRIWGNGHRVMTTSNFGPWNNYWHLSPRIIDAEGNVTGLVDSESIIITGENTVMQGNQINLTANITPLNATFDDVVWTSSDTSIATVDVSRGTVTSINPGVATITATTLDGAVIPDTGTMVPFYSTTFVITVTPPTGAGPFTLTLENFSPAGMMPQEYTHILDAGQTLNRIANGFGLNQHGGMLRGGEVITDGWVRNFQLTDWVVVYPQAFELGGNAWSNRSVTMPNSNVILQGDWLQHGGRYAIITFYASGGEFYGGYSEVERRSRVHEYWAGGSRPFQNILTLDALAPTPEKAGYEFIGWSLRCAALLAMHPGWAATLDGETINPDTLMDAPKTLYTVWEAVYIPTPPMIIEVIPTPVTITQGNTAAMTVVTENMPSGAWVDLHVAWHPGLSVIGGPRFHIDENGIAVITLAAAPDAQLGSGGFSVVARITDEWGTPVIVDYALFVINVVS